MNKLLNQNPLLWAALLSFVLSMGLSYGSLINSDGILYLRSAKEFAQGHWAQGYELYSWPFYAGLIAGFSRITTLTLEHSAMVIDAGLMALMAGGFVALARELGANKTTQWVAALVFLVHPGINGYREYIIRDFGAWAFLIWSLVFLCRFSKNLSWLSVAGWTVTTLLSFLFRPEIILWLMLGPLALLFSMPAVNLKQRCVAILKCQSIFIALAGLGATGILLFDINIPANKIHEMFASAQHILIGSLHNYALKTQAFSDLMSVYFKTDHALVVLGFALLFYWVFLTVKLLSPLYIILIGYSVIHRPLISQSQVRIALWMLFLYAGIYLLFIWQNYFISSRYLIPWVTVAMIWVPFALVHLWNRAPGALKSVLGLILLYMFLDGVLSFGYSKMYLKDSGMWIKQHTPESARLYTDDNHVAYYADRTLTEHLNEADVIAIYYSRKTPEAQQLIDSMPNLEQVDFHNKRLDGVRVFLKPSSKETTGR